MPLNPRNRKVKREWAEIAFLSKAHRLGFIVSRPWGDSDHYDFVIEGKRRRLYRIQVKSAWKTYEYIYRINTARTGNRYRYSTRDVDFIVAYVVPEDAWYVIPLRALGRRKVIAVFPHRPKSRSKFEKFRDNWRLLG